MGLLDSIVKGIFGKVSGGGTQNLLLDSIISLISNPETGGLAGLAQTFRDKGLSDIMGSWISTGKNLPITIEQIRHALGDQPIQEMAQKVGTSSQEVSSLLANLLPTVIDQLTPKGALPEGGMLEQGLSMLKKKFPGS